MQSAKAKSRGQAGSAVKTSFLMAPTGEEKGLATVKSEGGKKLPSRGSSGAAPTNNRRGKAVTTTVDDYGAGKLKLTVMSINEFARDFERLEKDALTMQSNGKTILDNFRNTRRHAVQSMQNPHSTQLSPKSPPFEHAHLKPGLQSYAYMPNEKILKILQHSEEISRQFSV